MSSTPEMPHMAQLGSDGPGCNCPGEIATELFNDPQAHRAVCPFGQWLEHLAAEGRTPAVKRWPGQQELPNDPFPSEPRMSGACPCKAIIEDEAKSFEQEASGYPAGSKENQVLLMHAEYLRQLSARIEVRRRFSQAVQS